MDSSNITSYINNHSKDLAFNKFKHLLYKHYPRFSNISGIGEFPLDEWNWTSF